jgi:CO/xanthine dehydrogenase FAD-binding subunit
MRSFLPDYDLLAPRSLRDALEMLAANPGSLCPFAGGTDLMVLLEFGRLPYRRFISLWQLDELRATDVGGDAVVVGALTTYTDVLRHPVLREEFPLLCAAAAETGGPATQNRGTIGGNIANGSPAADTPPALLVYDAELELVSVRGERRVRYDRFHTGYKAMDLAPDELIRAIRLPRGRSTWVQRYRKVGTRGAQAISKICFAAAVDVQDGLVRDVRIALGSVAPTVVRARRCERALAGKVIGPKSIEAARAAIAKDVAPIDDMRSTAAYRTRVAKNLLDEFLQSSNESPSPYGPL